MGERKHQYCTHHPRAADRIVSHIIRNGKSPAGVVFPTGIFHEFQFIILPNKHEIGI
jgi:hypothetical protein